MDFLGARKKTGQLTAKNQPIYGPYEWQNYNSIDFISSNIARAIRGKDFAPEIDGEAGEKRRFCGIWSKNRWEWPTILFANMKVKTTTVGFFDAMGCDAVEFIVNQTEMSTIFASDEYTKKILEFKDEGACTHIKNIINMDNDTTDEMK